MTDPLINWLNFDFKIAAVVFIAYLLIDAMYAYYTIAVVEKRPVMSASVGAVMHFLIAFGILNYVQNYLYVIPLAFGSWLGTYLVVKRSLVFKK
jgi:hypothetical protein